LVDIFYPSAGTVFSKEGLFQQPQAITLKTPLAFQKGRPARFHKLTDSAFVTLPVLSLPETLGFGEGGGLWGIAIFCLAIGPG
jgi:hypothetical protein